MASVVTLQCILFFLNVSALQTTKMITGFVSEDVTLPSGFKGRNPSQILWYYNNKVFIVYKNASEENNPPKKMVFRLNKEDGSLQIINLHKENSGVYRVTTTKGMYQHTEDITLTVVERIKKPEMKVLHLSPRAGFCLVNVTCVTFDNHSVEAVCRIMSGTSNCTETKNGSSPDLSIRISAKQKSISCDSSTSVSSNSSSIAINEHCAAVNKGDTNGTGWSIFLVNVLFALVTTLLISGSLE